MRYLFSLFILFCNIFFFSEVYSQNCICKDGFYIKTDSVAKEVYLNDVNEFRYKKSPRDEMNVPISLYGIKIQFLIERPEIEKGIFNDSEINLFKKSPMYATIYINSKTKRTDAVSFRFKNMGKNDIKKIDTKKFAKYREVLKEQINIQTLSFEKEVTIHGYVNQSFRVFTSPK